MTDKGVVRIFKKSKSEDMSSILMSYGIKTKLVSLSEGNTFDIYDIRLDRGVRVSKIERVLVDIGMELNSYTVPSGIPVVSDGVYRLYVQKSDIPSEGIEPILSLISEGSYRDMVTPIPIGIDMFDNVFVTELSKIPNLLIGGVPGSGKSMVLHSIILSLIANKRTEVYLADPKNVEFSIYDGLHSVKNISYNTDEVRQTAEGLIKVMNNRFDTLRRNRVRDFADFNKKSPRNNMNPIAFVIDEWADIYFQDKKIQNVICSLAQKGRAAGISVVIATQRPSADVISGLIKASFSGRICLKTSSSVDSRIVIDSGCADNILDTGVGYYKDQSNLEPKVFRSFYINSIESELCGLSPKKKGILSSMYNGGW